ncbi:hypothetical protein NIES2109_34130 [Nostoc sp. HK-01]|nr:hypothetical protein NIES2109_34130 [Nostoc sp. HK-01]
MSDIKFIVYHDLNHEDKHGFSSPSFKPGEQTLVVREQILPGAFGYPDMFIRHLNIIFQQQAYLIVSMTDYELDDIKRLEITTGGLNFLAQKND